MFEEVAYLTPAGFFWNPFPVGGALGRIATKNDEWISVKFTTPEDAAAWAAAAPSKTISWGESQVDGEATMAKVYITLSECMGDFRVPPVDVAAPANDPTFSQACKSFRRTGASPVGPRSDLPYQISTEPSSATACHLAPGKTYYINFVRSGVVNDTILPPSPTCINPDLEFCGVQMRVE